MDLRSVNTRGYSGGSCEDNVVCGSTDADSLFSGKTGERERIISVKEVSQHLADGSSFACGMPEASLNRYSQSNAANQLAPSIHSDTYREAPTGFRLNKLWGGLVRKESISSSVSASSSGGISTGGGAAVADMAWLRTSLAKRTDSLVTLQSQLEQIKSNFDKEREQLRTDLAQKNRRISELRETLDREREVSENVTMEIKTVQRQIELKDNDIQRRDAFIRELRGKVNCLEHAMMDVREELDRKAEQLGRFDEVRMRLENYERNFKVFPAFWVDRRTYSLTPISLILRMLPSACVYWVVIRRWNATEYFSMSEIKCITTVRIGGIDLPSNAAVPLNQYKYVNPGESFGATECLVIHNYCKPTLTLSFQSVELLEAAVSSITRMFKESQERERALRDEQQRVCLTEMEAMMFGVNPAAAARNFPCVFESPSSL